MEVEDLPKTALNASVANAFGVLAWEVELAGARCIQLDAIIGGLLATMSVEQRERLTDGMHTVDLLSQHLTSLSAFMRRMGEDAPAEVTAPVGGALAEITLGALADRMFTAFGGEEAVFEDQTDAGDLDLF